jgi:hypothetical protein
VIDGFEFNDGTRTFSCTVEGAHAAPRGAWWWFRVSTDDRHRYAPFQASPKDTRASVSSRVVAYYDDLMTRRAAPAPSYWRRGAPAKPAVAAAAPAAGTEVVVEQS